MNTGRRKYSVGEKRQGILHFLIGIDRMFTSLSMIQLSIDELCMAPLLTKDFASIAKMTVNFVPFEC